MKKYKVSFIGIEDEDILVSADGLWISDDCVVLYETREGEEVPVAAFPLLSLRGVSKQEEENK